jgi:hypothetical protein
VDPPASLIGVITSESNYVSKKVIHLMSVNQILLLMTSIALIAIPTYRASPAKLIFWFLFDVECCWVMYRAWARGMLTKTPQSITQDLMSKGRITTGPLELWSGILSWIALATILFA